MNFIIKRHFFLYIIFFWNCESQQNTEYLSNLNLNESSDKVTLHSFIALGDSYTIGESVSKKDRWPVQLVDSINKTSSKINSLKIIAKTGWTTTELLEGIENDTLEISYDWASLMIGVNNQYRGLNINNFKNEFDILLRKAISFCGGKKKRVFVLSIPDWGVTPFASSRNYIKIKKEIDAFNEVIKKVCMESNIRYFDITEISREASYNRTLIADDGLHPSRLMYKKWIKIIIPYILKENEKN